MSLRSLRARNGGVLVRTGQTEAAVDLARLIETYWRPQEVRGAALPGLDSTDGIGGFYRQLPSELRDLAYWDERTMAVAMRTKRAEDWSMSKRSQR